MSNSLQFRFVGADGRTEGRHVVVDGIVTFIVREYQMGGMQLDYYNEFFFLNFCLFMQDSQRQHQTTAQRNDGGYNRGPNGRLRQNVSSRNYNDK